LNTVHGFANFNPNQLFTVHGIMDELQHIDSTQQPSIGDRAVKQSMQGGWEDSKASIGRISILVNCDTAHI
jgi:hypothetical protein